MPDSGPTVASRTAMVVGGLIVNAARKLKASVEERTGLPFAVSYREDARTWGATRIDERFTPYPGVAFRRRDVHGRRLPGLRLGRRRGRGRGRPRHRRGDRPVASSPPTTSGASSTRCWPRARSRAAPCRPSGYATIEEIKLHDGRYLNDRLATYLIPTALDAPRIETILVEAPFAGAPHGAKGVGELPMDVGAPAVVAAIHDATGVWIHDLPASPERILAALDGHAPPGPPGVSTARGARRDGGDGAEAHELPRHGQRRRVRGRRAGHAPPARRPARGARADRHQGGLRRGRVRRLHRAPRRRGRGRLPGAHLPGGRPRRAHRRGPRRHLARRADPLTAADGLPHAGGAQCGICTPGMLVAAQAFLDSGAEPTEPAIREAIAGNLCRCTGYTKIVEAIAMAAGAQTGA